MTRMGVAPLAPLAAVVPAAEAFWEAPFAVAPLAGAAFVEAGLAEAAFLEGAGEGGATEVVFEERFSLDGATGGCSPSSFFFVSLPFRAVFFVDFREADFEVDLGISGQRDETSSSSSV